jgi:hypothetical protein
MTASMLAPFMCAGCREMADAATFHRRTELGSICWPCFRDRYADCLGCRTAVPVDDLAPLTNQYGGVVDRCSACRTMNALAGSPLREGIRSFSER